MSISRSDIEVFRAYESGSLNEAHADTMPPPSKPFVLAPVFAGISRGTEISGGR